MDFIKKHHEWVLVLIIVAVLGGSLPFKFSGDETPMHIFNVVGEFLGLDFFKAYGAYIIGVAELVASILVIIPSTRLYGAVIAAGTMMGAIFFHLASPLGWVVSYINSAGETVVDGSLANTAVLVLLSSLYLIYRRKDALLDLIGMAPASE